jgi:predicted nucleotidyltransferase/DNA-binding HxlR family transcriptional regulator
MLLHNYLEKLLGSKAKIKILRALRRHKGKEFTVRELADYIKISHTGVHKTLADLYDMNVVTLKSIGKSHTVSLNLDSHLTELVERLYGFEDDTPKELQRLIRNRLCSQAGIDSAAIFGSVARGEEEPRSDIDLMIMSSDRENAVAAASELQVEVSRRFGNPLAAYIVTREEMSEGRSPVIKDIREQNIMICGEPLE